MKLKPPIELDKEASLEVQKLDHSFCLLLHLTDKCNSNITSHITEAQVGVSFLADTVDRENNMTKSKLDMPVFP